MIDIRNLDKNCNREKSQVLALIREYLGEDRAIQSQQLMDKDCVEYVVAVSGDTVVGCSAYGFSGFHFSTWWIGFAAVLPEYRRLGLSDQMIDHRIRKIKEAGGEWIIAASLEPVDRVLKKGFVEILDMNPHKLIMLEIS